MILQIINVSIYKTIDSNLKKVRQPLNRSAHLIDFPAYLKNVGHNCYTDNHLFTS